MIALVALMQECSRKKEERPGAIGTQEELEEAREADGKSTTGSTGTSAITNLNNKKVIIIIRKRSFARWRHREESQSRTPGSPVSVRRSGKLSGRFDCIN
jgi:hypothetical protein